MVKKVELMGLEQFENEFVTFNKTSFWTYLKRLDEGNVERKLRVNIVYPVLRFFKDIKWFVLYRTTHRYHVVNSGLPPGYYDVDTVMLHTAFNLLKKFVEVELAWTQYCCNKQERKNKPWWMTSKRYVKLHGQRLGQQHLDYWHSAKGTRDAKNSEIQQKELTHIQKKDKEILDIYLWWINRDLRVSGNWKQETKNNKEDEQMLIRLAKVRLYLWT